MLFLSGWQFNFEKTIFSKFSKFVNLLSTKRLQDFYVLLYIKEFNPMRLMWLIL